MGLNLNLQVIHLHAENCTGHNTMVQFLLLATRCFGLMKRLYRRTVIGSTIATGTVAGTLLYIRIYGM